MSIILSINKYHTDIQIKHTLIYTTYTFVYICGCVYKKCWPVVYVCISESVHNITIWQNYRKYIFSYIFSVLFKVLTELGGLL